MFIFFDYSKGQSFNPRLPENQKLQSLSKFPTRSIKQRSLVLIYPTHNDTENCSQSISRPTKERVNTTKSFIIIWGEQWHRARSRKKLWRKINAQNSFFPRCLNSRGGWFVVLIYIDSSIHLWLSLSLSSFSNKFRNLATEKVNRN